MKETLSPATSTDESPADREIVPMTLPMQKLEVQDIPGYVLYWMRGTATRIAQAQRAGYEFVSEDEVRLNNVTLGGDARADGNTDMGTRVSVVTGDEVGRDGQPVRLILMKIKKEWWDKAQKVLADRSEKTAAAFRSGLVGQESPAGMTMDFSNRYMKGKVPDLFKSKTRRPS